MNTENLSIYAGIIIVTVASASAIFVEFNSWFNYKPLVFMHNHFKFFFPAGWGLVAWGVTKNPVIVTAISFLTGLAGLTVI